MTKHLLHDLVLRERTCVVLFLLLSFEGLRRSAQPRNGIDGLEAKRPALRVRSEHVVYLLPFAIVILAGNDQHTYYAL